MLKGYYKDRYLSLWPKPKLNGSFLNLAILKHLDTRTVAAPSHALWNCRDLSSEMEASPLASPMKPHMTFVFFTPLFSSLPPSRLLPHQWNIYDTIRLLGWNLLILLLVSTHFYPCAVVAEGLQWLQRCEEMRGWVCVGGVKHQGNLCWMLVWDLIVAALGRTRSFCARRWDESLFGEKNTITHCQKKVEGWSA